METLGVYYCDITMTSEDSYYTKLITNGILQKTGTKSSTLIKQKQKNEHKTMDSSIKLETFFIHCMSDLPPRSRAQ